MRKSIIGTVLASLLGYGLASAAPLPTKVDRSDLLEIQNLELQLELARTRFAAKYQLGPEDQVVGVQIVRAVPKAPKPPAPTPSPAKK